MDIHFVLYWFITVCSFNQVHFTVAHSKLPESDGVLTTSTEESKQCETKLYSCKLKFGHNGIYGIPGSQGARGEQGKVGEMGPKGHIGEPGSKGDKGETGSMGNVGQAGSKGELGEKGDIGLPGIPGQQGLQGGQGPKGDVGIKGEIGFKGEAGSVGIQGIKGDTGAQGIAGDKGLQGERGYIGYKGDPGLKGDRGPVGPLGMQGLTGETGIKGDAGPPGIPGQPGSCLCLNSEEFKVKEKFPVNDLLPTDSGKNTDMSDNTGDSESVEETDNVVQSCKHVKSTTGIPSNKFQVKCDMKRNMTCIHIDEPSNFTIEREFVGHGYEYGPFWMSEKNFSFTNFYNGITIEQIEWLQAQSTFITQTIRYHCKNSYIYPKSNEEKALRLLSWKETVLGPKPTENTPFFYSIPAETDGCENSGEFKTIRKYSDIKLISTTKGLPVINFQIRDIRKEKQWVYLELRELCFG